MTALNARIGEVGVVVEDRSGGTVPLNASAEPPADPRPRTRAFRLLVIASIVGAVASAVVTAFDAPTAIVLGSMAAASLPMFVALLVRPQLATLMFVGLLYLNVPVVAVRYWGVPDVVGPLAILLLAIPMYRYLIVERRPLVGTPALACLVIYLGTVLLSGAAAGAPDGVGDATALLAVEGLLPYFLVTNAIRDMQTLRLAIIVVLATGALVGGLSLYQTATGTYANDYGGFAQTKDADAEFEEEDDGAPRLSGSIGSKNRYAQVMLVLLPFALAALILARSLAGRVLAAGAGMLVLFGMASTLSRGAAVALAALVIVAAILRLIPLRVLAAVVVVTVIAAPLLVPQYVARLETLAGIGGLASEDAEQPDGAVLGRATSNLAALNVFLDHPVTGVGPGQYPSEYSQRYANQLNLRYFTTPRRAHNMYLEVAADTGILGITALMAVFGTTLWGTWQARRRWRNVKPEYAVWASALMLSIVGYMLTAVFLHVAYMRYLFILLALANCAIWIMSREGRLPSQAATPPARQV